MVFMTHVYINYLWRLHITYSLCLKYQEWEYSTKYRAVACPENWGGGGGGGGHNVISQYGITKTDLI